MSLALLIASVLFFFFSAYSFKAAVLFFKSSASVWFTLDASASVGGTVKYSDKSLSLCEGG
jgi:hypothetical protein